MAILNGNSAYLSFNGTQLDGYWTGAVSRSVNTATVDVTAGSGATHVERNAGLSDTSMSFAVVYDDTNIATYVTALAPGTKGALIYGPEGNGTGKPKFQCSMILTSVDGPNASIDKNMVSFELSFEGAAAPTATIEDGDTF